MHLSLVSTHVTYVHIFKPIRRKEFTKKTCPYLWYGSPRLIINYLARKLNGLQNIVTKFNKC